MTAVSQFLAWYDARQRATGKWPSIARLEPCAFKALWREVRTTGLNPFMGEDFEPDSFELHGVTVGRA